MAKVSVAIPLGGECMVMSLLRGQDVPGALAVTSLWRRPYHAPQMMTPAG